MTRDQQIVHIARTRIDRALSVALDAEALADLADELVQDAEQLSANGLEEAAEGIMDAIEELLDAIEDELAEEAAEDRRRWLADPGRLGASPVIGAPFVDEPPPEETVVLRALLVGQRPTRC